MCDTKKNPFEGDGEAEAFDLKTRSQEKYEHHRTAILRSKGSDRINRGWRWKRTKYKDPFFDTQNLERIISEEWECECVEDRGLNQGFGLAQNLFIESKESVFGFGHGHYAKFILTKRERMIAATCIQWLGTNCGYCFLETCLNKAGIKLVRMGKD